MHILFIVIIVIVGLVGILLLLGLFLKKEIKVEREITIDKPKHIIYNFLKYARNQEHYSVWVTMDPDMKKEYIGEDGTIGFIYTWESLKKRNVGQGEQEIIKMIDNERIEYELRFIKPMTSIAIAKFVLTSTSENQTKVRWGFDSNMKFPMNVMRIFINMDEMLGKDLQTGLNNLKAHLEK